MQEQNKLYPWSDFEYTEPEDYRWDCIDTEITELPDIISWCMEGLFLPSLYQVNFGTTSNINCERSFASNAIITPDITSGNKIQNIFSSLPVITTEFNSPTLDLLPSGHLILVDSDDVGNGSIVDGVLFDPDTNLLYIGDIGYTGSDYQNGSYSVNQSTGELTRVEDRTTYSGGKMTLIKDAVNGDILIMGANSYIYSYRVVNGYFTLLHRLAQPGNFAWETTHHVYPNGDEFIFTVGGLGLRSFTVNHVTGTITVKATHRQSTREYRGVWADDNWVYVSAHDEGLRVYEVTPLTGALTHKTNYDGGANVTHGIWSDGTYIFQANGGGGVRTYEVDPDTAAINYKGVRGGNNIDYLSGDDYGYVYGCSSSIVVVFTKAANGVLVYKETLSLGGTCYGIKATNNYIYVAHRDLGTAVVQNV